MCSYMTLLTFMVLFLGPLFPANFDEAEMLQLDFTHLGFGSKCSLALSDVLESVHWTVIPVLRGWIGREKIHLLTVRLACQAGVVMDLNGDMFEESDLSAWLYEVGWAGRLVAWRQLKWPTETGVDEEVNGTFVTA